MPGGSSSDFDEVFGWIVGHFESLASAFAVACLPRSVDAQGATKVVRIGWLTAQQAPSLVPYVDANARCPRRARLCRGPQTW